MYCGQCTSITTFFFLWWKLLKSSLLATFNRQYSIINYSHYAVHYIFITYVYFVARILYLLTTSNCHHGYITHPPTTPTLLKAATNLISISVSSGYFQVLHVSEITWYLSQLFDIAWYPQDHKCHKWQDFLFLWLSAIYHIFFIHWYTRRLSPYLGYCK